MTLIGILAAMTLFVVWLVIRRPRWLAVAGKVLFDAMAVAGRWYSLTEPGLVCRAVDPSPDTPSDAAGLSSCSSASLDAAGLHEADLTARLLTGLLAREDYQRAMADLAADDATRHPLPIPPGIDG